MEQTARAQSMIRNAIEGIEATPCSHVRLKSLTLRSCEPWPKGSIRGSHRHHIGSCLKDCRGNQWLRAAVTTIHRPIHWLLADTPIHRFTGFWLIRCYTAFSLIHRHADRRKQRKRRHRRKLCNRRKRRKQRKRRERCQRRKRRKWRGRRRRRRWCGRRRWRRWRKRCGGRRRRELRIAIGSHSLQQYSMKGLLGFI